MFIAALFRTTKNLEWTWVFFNWWMDEQILLPDSGILPSNTKNKLLICTCHNIDEFWTRAVWKKPESKGCMLNGSLCMLFWRRENCSDGEQSSDGQGYLHRNRTKEFGGDGIVLYPDCGDGHRTLCISQ